MNKALVTGASGFVGTHLINGLLLKGHNVVASGFSPSSHFDPEVEYIAADLTSQTEVAKISFKGIDTVYHLAGLAAVGPSFEKPAEYLRVNTEIEINLFEECLKQSEYPNFVIVSSSQVYSPEAKQPYTEEAPLSPPSPYAASKLAQEFLALHYSRRRFKVVIARPFNHIGPGQSEGFLIPDLAKQIANLEKQGGGTLRVGNLESKRDFTDVRDIVRAYVALAEKGKPGESYNICSGSPISGIKILEILSSLSEAEIKIEQDPSKNRPADVPCMYGDCTKLHRDTEWKPEIPLERTLQDALNDWRGRV